MAIAFGSMWRRFSFQYSDLGPDDLLFLRHDVGSCAGAGGAPIQTKLSDEVETITASRASVHSLGEQVFATLKHSLRKAAARTVEAVCVVIGEILQAFTPQECDSYLTNSGYRT